MSKVPKAGKSYPLPQMPSGFIPDDQFKADALPDGFIPDDKFVDDEEKYGGLGGETKAFLAGAARGATFGLSDVGLTKTGLVDPETLKGLRETNPTSSIAGELTGVVGPALIPGVGAATLTGQVAKGGAAVGKAVAGTELAAGLGKMGAQALAGATGMAAEGAVYGLGQSISDSALGDQDLVSQQTLANIGLSAALSGGMGGLIGAYVGRKGKTLYDLSSPEAKFQVAKAMQEAPAGSPEAVIASTGLPAEEKQWLFKALAQEKPDAKVLRQEFQKEGLPEVLGMMHDNETIQKMASAVAQTPTSAGNQVREAVDLGYQKVDDILKQTLKASEHRDAYEAGALIKNQIEDVFQKKYEPLKEIYASRRALGKNVQFGDKAATKLYNKFERLPSILELGETSPFRAEIKKYAERALAESASPNALNGLDDLAKELRVEATKAFQSGDSKAGIAYAKMRDMLETFNEQQLLRVSQDMTKEGFDPAAKEMAKNMVKEYRQVKKDYRELKKIMASLGQDQKLGRKVGTEMGLAETLGKIPNEKLVQKMFDPKNVDGLTRLKQNFPDVYDTLVTQFKSQVYQDALNNKNFNPLNVLKFINDEKKISAKTRQMLFSPEELERLGTAKKWIENLPPRVGPSGTPEGMQYMDIVKRPVQSLIGMGIDEAGTRITKKFIESLANPEEAKHIQTLISIEKAARQTKQQMQRGVKSIIKNDSLRSIVPKASSMIVTPEEYKKKSEELNEAANNPMLLEEKLHAATSPVFENAPNVASMSQMTMIRGIQFLASKTKPIPKVGFFQQQILPSQAEVSKFNRYYQIVEDPMLALDQVRSGQIGPETVETLSAVYPKLYNEMKKELMDQVSGLEDPSSVPFKTRMAISMFLQAPADLSLAPQNVMANQMVFSQPQNQQTQPVKPSKVGMREMTLADRTSNSRRVDA